MKKLDILLVITVDWDLYRNMQIETLYQVRFGSEEDLKAKSRIWKVLCQLFFQRYIREGDTVIDLASGYCEFINHIQARKKIAVDVNQQGRSFVHPDVEFICNSCLSPEVFNRSDVDVFFMSNLLEHLDSKEQVFQLFSSCHKALRKGGRLLIMQPNIRFVGAAYWDFFDHKLPFTDKSLVEGLITAGFEIERVIPRFFPYTTKGRLPKHPFLVAWYLRCLPFSGWLLGKQSFVAARKT